MQCACGPLVRPSRDRGYLSTVRGLRLFAEHTPDSHQERKWSRQGHSPPSSRICGSERAGRMAALAGNRDVDQIAVVVSDVSCPVHGAERGDACPGQPGVCKPRVRKWMLARDQKITRGKQRRAGHRKGATLRA